MTTEYPQVIHNMQVGAPWVSVGNGRATRLPSSLLETRAEELLDQNPPESHSLSLAAAIRVSTDRLAEVDPTALALVRIGAFLVPNPSPPTS